MGKTSIRTITNKTIKAKVVEMRKYTTGWRQRVFEKMQESDAAMILIKVDNISQGLIKDNAVRVEFISASNAVIADLQKKYEESMAQ